MSITETKISGKKYRVWDSISNTWKRFSFWNKASDTEFDDGTDVQTNLGSIKGITDSLVSTSSNIALSAKAGKDLNESLTEIGKLTRIGVISLNAPVNVDLAQYRKAYSCIEIDNYVYNFHPMPVDFLNKTKRISISYFYGTSNYVTASLDLSKTKAVLADCIVVGFSTVKIALYGEK